MSGLQNDVPHHEAHLWARVLEVYKARLQLNTALAVGVITLTGYGLTNRTAIAFLIAAAIALLAAIIDAVVKWNYATPLLYKLLSLEATRAETEPPAMLLLSYTDAGNSEYAKLFSEQPSMGRRRKFRRLYVFRNLWHRALLFGGAAIVEVLLAARAYVSA